MKNTLKVLQRSEWGVALLFGWALLIAGPPLLALVIVAAKFQGLLDPLALENAGLARSIAAGKGFVTEALRPLWLVAHPQVSGHPDLYHSPGFPYVLSAFFKLFGSTDRTTSLAGAGLWILSVWLTFGVARYWFDTPTAALAAFLYFCSVPALAGAVQGLPYVLLAIVLLLAAWATLSWEHTLPDEEEEDAEPGEEAQEPNVTHERPANLLFQPFPAVETWRIGLAGFAAGIAVLVHPLGIAFAFLLGLLLVSGSERRGRACGIFCGLMLAAMAPWLWRSFRLGGSPLFTFYWYELLTGTNEYPGGSVWRLATVPDPPLLFAVSHPLQTLRKLINGLTFFRRELPMTVDPLIFFCAGAALLMRVGTVAWQWFTALLIGSLLLVAAASSLLRPEPGLLAAWAPLLAIVAAHALSTWVSPFIPRRIGKRLVPARMQRRAIYALLLTMVALPMLQYVVVARPGTHPQLAERLGGVKSTVPEGGWILTDAPEAVAWYSGRPAVWLPQRETDLDQVEKAAGPAGASLLLGATTHLSAEERGQWWFWIEMRTGNYRGLAISDRGPSGAIFRLRSRESVLPTRAGRSKGS